MLRLSLMFLSLLLVSGCARYGSPNIEPKQGEKIVMGSIRTVTQKESKFNDLRMFIAPVQMVKDEGKTIAVVDKPKLYRIKGSTVDALAQDAFSNSFKMAVAVPFFIPMRPGTYLLKSVGYGYPNDIIDYRINLGEGILITVDDKFDATNIGQIIVQDKLDWVPETTIKQAYLATHHGHTIKDLDYKSYSLSNAREKAD